MPKSENQKLKLLYIADYLTAKTDENHYVTSADIIKMLASNGITAERKSVYTDVDALRSFGMDIDISKGRTGGIRLLSKRFELTELKLLVDAIQSSRFITEKKTYALIGKLSEMTSEYERKELQRLVFISNRIKNENESIYYSADNIYSAINTDCQISFLYFNYGADKKKHYHNNSQLITVSPYGLQFDNEKYYMIAYDSKAGIIKHYRVDKMEAVSVTDKPREGKSHFKKFDIASYANATHNMFSGEVTNITLRCTDKFAGAVIDKFGNKIKFIPAENDTYTVMVKAILSPALYSWVFTFGGEVTILNPPKAVDEYKKQLTDAIASMSRD